MGEKNSLPANKVVVGFKKLCWTKVPPFKTVSVLVMVTDRFVVDPPPFWKMAFVFTVKLLTVVLMLHVKPTPLQTITSSVAAGKLAGTIKLPQATVVQVVNEFQFPVTTA